VANFNPKWRTETEISGNPGKISNLRTLELTENARDRKKQNQSFILLLET
jgi:hypothetical protein